MEHTARLMPDPRRVDLFVKEGLEHALRGMGYASSSLPARDVRSPDGSDLTAIVVRYEMLRERSGLPHAVEASYVPGQVMDCAGVCASLALRADAPLSDEFIAEVADSYFLWLGIYMPRMESPDRAYPGEKGQRYVN